MFGPVGENSVTTLAMLQEVYGDNTMPHTCFWVAQDVQRGL